MDEIVLGLSIVEGQFSMVEAQILNTGRLFSKVESHLYVSCCQNWEYDDFDAAYNVFGIKSLEDDCKIDTFLARFASLGKSSSFISSSRLIHVVAFFVSSSKQTHFAKLI